MVVKEFPLATDEDILIFIGRHYNWKYDRMQDWFNRSDDLEI